MFDLSLGLMSGGNRNRLPEMMSCSQYFDVPDLQDSIGLSAITLTVISGTTAADLVIEVSGLFDLLGIADETEMTWVEFQDECDGNGFIFAGVKGCLVYSVDMSADEAKIMRYLGGLYVPPFIPGLPQSLPYTLARG